MAVVMVVEPNFIICLFIAIKVERKIQLLQKEVSDYSKDELEGLVAIEEKEIIKNYKNFSIMALLSLLGLNYFNH